jgi:4-diphosphocytidyl-2-C-methyl-D-erythritol kinase
MDRVTIKAPAKVNLFLDVLKRRRDGYHDIVTVFESVDLCDTVTLARKAGRGITLSCNGGIAKKDNLAYKAAHLIISRSRLRRGVAITIKKQIPVAAGLGGGSSDAAATLVGINKLYRLGYGKDVLLTLARSLGADVPFFILERSFALGVARGDAVTALAIKPPKMWHLIIFPGVKKLTKDVYGALRLNLTKQGGDVTILLHALEIGNVSLMRKATYNRLEDPAFDRDPGLGALKSRLIQLGMEGALLAGSGPTMFSLAKTRKEAVAVKEKILKALGMRAEGWHVFIVPTLVR